MFTGLKYIMKRRSRKIRRNLILGAAAVVLLILILTLVHGIGSLMNRSVDTSEGVNYIKKKEKEDLTEIETQIEKLEQQESTGDEGSRGLKEKFANTVVMGDSIPQGFADYNVLNSSNVTAKIGAHLTQLDDQIKAAKKMNPTIVFLSIGENDVTSTDGDVDLFIKQYKEVIDEISAEMPEASIFINSIFPVQEKALKKEPELEKIPDYNQALSDLCKKLSLGYIDNSDLVQDKYYEDDGQHFKYDFYPVWAEHMAEVAAL